jgi:hypothetical protein
MVKTAIVVLAASDSPEGRGRMVHAPQAASELMSAGEEVRGLLEGIGVTWSEAFHGSALTAGTTVWENWWLKVSSL